MVNNVNCSDSKEMEQEIESLKEKLKNQEEVKRLAEQIVHDIHSPLLALSIFVRSCESLSEKDHAFLESAIDSIENITRNLINKYEENGGIEKSVDSVEEYIFVPFCLSDIVQTKKYQIRKPNIKINFLKDIVEDFVFIKGNNTNFKRLISNLINNAVESLDINGGTIEVGFNVENQEVKIHVQDNGSEISNENFNITINDNPDDNAKENGYYSGIWKAKNIVEKMNGKMFVQSEENIGTKITLVFTQSESPEWITKEVIIPKNSIVVILDDDHSTYKLLENRLYGYLDDIEIKYFNFGKDAFNFINSFKEKEKIFLLADYDLRNQNISGIDVIEKCKLQKQSILVSSRQAHKIRNFSDKSKFIKFLSKAHIPNIPFKIM